MPAPHTRRNEPCCVRVRVRVPSQSDWGFLQPDASLSIHDIRSEQPNAQMEIGPDNNNDNDSPAAATATEVEAAVAPPIAAVAATPTLAAADANDAMDTQGDDTDVAPAPDVAVPAGVTVGEAGTIDLGHYAEDFTISRFLTLFTACWGAECAKVVSTVVFTCNSMSTAGLAVASSGGGSAAMAMDTRSDDAAVAAVTTPTAMSITVKMIVSNSTVTVVVADSATVSDLKTAVGIAVR